MTKNVTNQIDTSTTIYYLISTLGPLARILLLTVQVIFYIMFGCIVFILLPAIVFTCIEAWNYLDSVYFAFITLSTIGFGDLVPGNNNSSKANEMGSPEAAPKLLKRFLFNVLICEHFSLCGLE